MTDTPAIRERAFLVGIQFERSSQEEVRGLLLELEALAASCGIEVCGSMIAKIREPNAGLLVGSGKLEEIVASAREHRAMSIIVDYTLTSVQERNWQKEASLNVYNRSALIVKIFASRARSKEAKAQVELARCEYELPRLAHSYEPLSRQRGGHYGTRGSGEQKIELDRRRILDRIKQLKTEIKDLSVNRKVQRSRRESNSIPCISIIGYTNAGKSSLLNALCGSSVVAENRLFVSLDPATRKMSADGGRQFLLTDTVGFVRNLPHELIDAFKATFEEVLSADALLHVIDASSPNLAKEYETSRIVLGRIGVHEKLNVLVLNKIDLVDEAKRIALSLDFPGAVQCSTTTGEGLDNLVATLASTLSKEMAMVTVEIPDKDYGLVSLLRRETTIMEEAYLDGTTSLTLKLPAHLKGKVAAYIVKHQ